MGKRLDPANWKHGTVNLFSALGFTQPFTYPQLSTSITKQVEAADAKSSPGSKASTTAPPSGTAPTNAKHYSYTQLEQLWVQAGGNPKYAAIAAAIAMAESGGNADATDYDSNGTVDRGLWQINSIHSSLSTYNPLANAKAAVSISQNGTNWQPWVTYQTGAYKRYLQ